MAGRAPETKATAKAQPADCFAVVAARFNEAISKKLADGAVGVLERGGVAPGRIETHWVPGSFELPQAALALARTGRYAGIVCVGVVIKGETPHFEYLASTAAQGIGRAALDTGVPISFGVVTALSPEQAWARAGGAVGNRGEEAALATLEMAEWLRAMRATPRHKPRGPGQHGRRRGREFAEILIRGAKLHEPKIDEIISQYALNWELDRMAVVDRNILRQGVFELLWMADVPPKVAINEALEIAKKFSTHESGRFINGILDRIHKELRPPT